jgi:hypothetical protein
MQGYIREEISANTLSLTNADTSPFVTKTEMVKLFAEFEYGRAMYYLQPSTQHRPSDIQC